MIAKIWKKALFVILIVACLFNVVSKLVKRYPLKTELESAAQYLEENKQNKTIN